MKDYDATEIAFKNGYKKAIEEIFEDIELWLAFGGDIRIITAEKFAELKKKYDVI